MVYINTKETLFKDQEAQKSLLMLYYEKK